jgi:hypothetical protein
VSYRDSLGVAHSVIVDASGLYEAACYALREVRARGAGWGEGPGPGTELTVEVLPPPAEHRVRVSDVMRCLRASLPTRRRSWRRPV